MVKSFSLFNAFKGKTDKDLEVNIASVQKRRSPTMSMASFSSMSTTSTPDSPTVTTPIHMESRGIFRTLEPIWYFHQSATLEVQNRNDDGWIPFDSASAMRLEQAHSGSKLCTLPNSALGLCTVVFNPSLEKKRPTSLFGQAAGTLAGRCTPMNEKTKSSAFIQVPYGQLNKALPPVGRVLYFNKNVRRSVAPVWWFEQDAEDGQKGMCRFDARNQVRLEALSDHRSQLSLTDTAFPQPFTVMLDTNVSRENREEMRGFLYLQTHPTDLGLRLPPGSLDPKLQQQRQQVTEESMAYETVSWGDSLTKRFSM